MLGEPVNPGPSVQGNDVSLPVTTVPIPAAETVPVAGPVPVVFPAFQTMQVFCIYNHLHDREKTRHCQTIFFWRSNYTKRYTRSTYNKSNLHL